MREEKLTKKEWFSYLVVALIFLTLFFGLLWVVVSASYSAPSFASQNFCNGKGYESYNLGREYSERFGKVECISCYGEICIKEEFNVTRNWYNGLEEVRG